VRVRTGPYCDHAANLQLQRAESRPRARMLTGPQISGGIAPSNHDMDINPQDSSTREASGLVIARGVVERCMTLRRRGGVREPA